MGKQGSADKTIREIRGKTRRKFLAEEKICIVIEGLRGKSGRLVSRIRWGCDIRTAQELLCRKDLRTRCSIHTCSTEGISATLGSGYILRRAGTRRIDVNCILRS